MVITIAEDGRVHQYTLVQQHATSDRYGNCEICGKFVSDMYSQKHEHLSSVGGEHPGWASDGDAFGHKECLIRIRNRAKAVGR